MDPQDLTLESLGLDARAAASLPEGLRRRLARFLLRWGRPDLAGPVLPDHDVGPRDRFNRCCALLGSGHTDEARDLARELVNDPDAGAWGHRAVGEVFLALERPERADERFRAGDDPAGRARAHLLMGKPEAALELLGTAPPDDAGAESARCEALRALGKPAEAAERRLGQLFAEERAELLDALGATAFPGGPAPSGPDALREAFQAIFGYEDFRPGQLDTILPLMRGESVLALMPTGAGKSVCYQLPAALLPSATVVISPLIALMKDQVEGLPARLYRRATLINSSLEPGEADRRMEAIASGEVSLIYAAPERLRQWSFIRALQRRGVSLFVIDEAHCVSLWGHDFRPDYLFIRQVLRDLGRPTVLAVTATATPVMQEDIGRQLDVPLKVVNLGTFRPNLRLSTIKLPGQPGKWDTLLRLLREEKGAAIVYVDRRKLAEELAEKLRQEGISAEGYHAGMDRERRDRVQTRFMLGEVRVMAATVAFGMGVDKADVRLVVHYNLPRSLEAYYQEAGRAGRDGLPARCVLLYTTYDKGNLTRRAAGDRLQQREVLALHRALCSRLARRQEPVNAGELERDGSNPTRVRVMISLLQGIGAVKRGYDLPGSVWLARPNGGGDERFLRFAEAAGLGERSAAALASGQIAAAAGVPLEALEPALLDWQERGWLRCRGGSRGMGLRAVETGADLQAHVKDALARMAELDDRRLELLGQYLETTQCRQGFVSEYFGRPLPEGCGGCDNCRIPAEAASRVAERAAVGYTASTPARGWSQRDRTEHAADLITPVGISRSRPAADPAENGIWSTCGEQGTCPPRRRSPRRRSPHSVSAAPEVVHVVCPGAEV